MARSFAQPIDTTCVACGRRFEATLWLIVDAAERPDLLQAIANDMLQITRCPHCGADQPLDAPLLFHRAADQMLILAMPEGSNDAQTTQAAQQLGAQLIASIPVEERQPYLAQAHTVIGSDGLRQAISSVDALSLALPALMAAQTPEAVQHVIVEHPILQGAEAHQHLDEYAQTLSDRGHTDLANAVRARLAALQATQHPRPMGALELIQALLDAPSPEHRHAVLDQHRAAITDDLPPIVAVLADQAQGQGLDAVARDLRVIRAEILDRIKQHPQSR